MVAAAQAQAVQQAHVAHAARYGYPTGYPAAMAPSNNYSHLIHGQGTRKNATRESTQQLKLWLQEHQKNPYPTKAEKVYLALISGKNNFYSKLNIVAFQPKKPKNGP